MATLVHRLRREADHSLFVLAGDTLSPSTLSAVLRGRQMVEAWNAVGLDAATFGNHEFDWGPDTLRERMTESRFAWISSNVWEATRRRPFGGASRFLVLDWSGVRVGVVGLTTADTANSSRPGPEVSFEPPLQAAAAAFDEVRALDMRVAVTHLPLRQDRDLARSVPLDLILGGHDHDPMITEQGATGIVKAGSDAVNVGRAEYEFGCRARIVNRRLSLIPVDASIPESPAVTGLVARYTAMLDRELQTEVGRTRIELDARVAVIRRQETALGRFVATVMKERVGAELAMLNSGAFRANRLIPPGPLTKRDLHELLPFGNLVVLAELRGSTLKSALEHSVDALPAPAGRFLQTAGLSYALDAERPVGQRVSDMRVQGHPLDPEKTYRVATSDYLARGQDGYGMLAGAPLLVGYEDGPGLLQSVLDAFAEGRSP